MIFWSLCAWSLVTAATAFAQTSHQLLLARAFLGVAESAYLPAAIALIADFHGSKSRGTALGIHLAGLNFGLIAGGAGAGYLADHFGWRAGFGALGSTGLIMAVIARVVLRDQHYRDPPVIESRSVSSAFRDFLELVRIPSYLVVLTEAMLVSIGTWIFFNWLPLYFREAFNMSLGMAGFSGTFVLQIAATAGSLLGGFASDRVSGRRPERRMLLMSVCYLASAPFLLAFRAGPGVPVLSLCLLVYSLIRSLGASNEGPVLCDLLRPQLRSSSIALLNTANCIAGGSGVLVTGFLKANFGLAGIFSCVSIILIAAAATSFVGYVFFIRKDMARSSAQAVTEGHAV
jgi:predicted MFS family arabinose efflux permease